MVLLPVCNMCDLCKLSLTILSLGAQSGCDSSESDLKGISKNVFKLLSICKIITTHMLNKLLNVCWCNTPLILHFLTMLSFAKTEVLAIFYYFECFFFGRGRGETKTFYSIWMSNNTKRNSTLHFVWQVTSWNNKTNNRGLLLMKRRKKTPFTNNN
jgi:hypothetical protein